MCDVPIATCESPTYSQHHEKNPSIPSTSSTSSSISSSPLVSVTYEDETKAALVDAIASLAHTPSFPGPQPTSVDRGMFAALQRDTYLVAEKTDGIRMMLVFVEVDGYKLAAAFDRSMRSFWMLNFAAVSDAMWQGTLFDGELVFDQAAKAWTFLVFDAVCVCGSKCLHLPLDRRLGAAWRALQRLEHHASDTVRVETKMFHLLDEATPASIRDERFANDGYVFAPMNAPITLGRHDSYFKLKTHHTVDLKLGVRGTVNAYNVESKRNVKQGEIMDDPDAYPPGCILECELVQFDRAATRRRWRVVCVRTDKTSANTTFVVDKTLLNAREKLTFEDVKAAATGRNPSAVGH